jgi:hypothetical protein
MAKENKEKRKRKINYLIGIFVAIFFEVLLENAHMKLT